MQNRNYLNNNNMQKGIALATCMAIVMGLFTGCGKKNDLQIAASPDEVQKGRYVERNSRFRRNGRTKISARYSVRVMNYIFSWQEDRKDRSL